MRYVVSAMLIVAGIIHLLPLVGVLGSDQLHRLYGVVFDDPNLAILMRHRAVVFGLLGALMIYAAFRNSLQVIAVVAGLISAGSFAWISWSVGGNDAILNAAMLRVVAADWAAIGCLVVAVLVKFWEKSA